MGHPDDDGVFGEGDDPTVVEGSSDAITPTVKREICECGDIRWLDEPGVLAGLTVIEWPCVRGRRWRYCRTTGRIMYDVR